MHCKILICVLITSAVSVAARADIDCISPRVYNQDLTQKELDFLLAVLPVFDERPAALTVLETTSGPIYQLVTTCDNGNEWVSETGMSSDEYQDFFDKHAALGYRPLLVEAYGDYPNETYLSVMINDGISARGRHRIDPDDWLTVREELKELDLVPTWFSSYGSGTNTRYACVWTDPGNADGMRTLTNMTAGDFIEDERDQRYAGSRLISVSVHGSTLDPRFGGFFTRGIQPEWSVHTNLIGDELPDLVLEKEKDGWEVDVVTAYNHIVRRYIAVFKRDPHRTFRVTGTENIGFEQIDAAMETYMRNGLISRGALAITDPQGRLVLARGYTWDSTDTTDTEPTDIFRIASVSKSVTAVAIMALLEDESDLDLDAPVAELLSDWEWCGLGCLKCQLFDCDDPFWPSITYRHLLSHHAGIIRWAGGSEGDPMGADRDVRDRLNALNGDNAVTLPVSLDDIHTFMRTQGFDVAPGTSSAYAYSNYGYSLLGRIIEQATGMTYEDYVQDRILDPLCIQRMQIGTADGDAENEVEYHDAMYQYRRTVMEEDDEKWVPRAYGGGNIANYDAHGGWIASAIDLAAFTSSLRDPDNSPILSSASINSMWSAPTYDSTRQYGLGWSLDTDHVFHSGSISGTRSLIVRWDNGATYSVVFNRRNRDAAGRTNADDNIRQAINDQWNTITWPIVDHWDDYICTEFLPADINHDGVVNGLDLTLLLGSWGSSGAGDLNGDEIVDGVDLALLLGSWTL